MFDFHFYREIDDWWALGTDLSSREIYLVDNLLLFVLARTRHS